MNPKKDTRKTNVGEMALREEQEQTKLLRKMKESKPSKAEYESFPKARAGKARPGLN